MKRFLILVMILGLVVGSVATAEAAQKTKTPARAERTVEGHYSTYPMPGSGPPPRVDGWPATCDSLVEAYECFIVETRPTEASFTAKVTDAHGQPVFVRVEALGFGLVGRFCGETSQPLRIERGAELHFYLGASALMENVECPGHSVKTSGTITVTLSNRIPDEVEGPLRSGSIVGGAGWLLDQDLGGCQVAPECAVWLQEGCDPALAGRDPGLTASIVDVDDLGDLHTEAIFKFGAGEPWGPVWGGAHVQFWDHGCSEMRDMRWRSTDCNGDSSGRDCYSRRFRLTPSVKWMTVTGYQDNVNLAWSLTEVLRS